jgi:hypothetical protein
MPRCGVRSAQRADATIAVIVLRQISLKNVGEQELCAAVITTVWSLVVQAPVCKEGILLRSYRLQRNRAMKLARVVISQPAVAILGCST